MPSAHLSWCAAFADKAKSVDLAVRVLEEAAARRTVAAPQVIKALSALEKAKLPVSCTVGAFPIHLLGLKLCLMLGCCISSGSHHQGC